MPNTVFAGHTEMAHRMRAFDWATTSLGPVEQWPQSLRTSVSICLDCAFPIVLWWGPELAILYNDEYRSCLGPTKHPSALGQPGAVVWAEIWDVIAPMLAGVVERGEATRSRDLLLHIEREGYPEEAYFSFSYSPIRGEDGKVGGVFCPVIETTEKVIGERRLRTLKDLAAGCKGAESEAAAWAASAGILSGNPHDVPFALIFRVDDGGRTATLCAAAGIERGSSSAPERVALDTGHAAPWALAEVARNGRTVLIEDLGSRFEELPTGAWKVPAQRALVLPVQLPGQERPYAILVAAVSPMRALDEAYRTFYGLVATQIAAGLADARALAEERRRAAALAEIDRAKTAFFSNVSHEFRTPLTLMLGPLEDLMGSLAGDLPTTAVESLAVVHRNSLRLLKLVNTLLDFSRIEAGRVEANYEPTDLAAYTADLASVFRSAVERAGVRLVVDCPPLDGPAYVDRDMWEKIVLNLLSNALKFTFEGEIRVRLEARADGLTLTVADTGVGIPADDLPRMFQRFHRVKNARSRTHEGTGIGLALVQELARQHGGTVRVESKEGEGTTFTVTIPPGHAHLPKERVGGARQLAPTGVRATSFVEEALRWLPEGDVAEDAARRALAADLGGELADSAFAPAQDAARPRVLLADDNADMREYLKRLLAPGFDVTAVADGQAALELARSNRPDLVLADVMMPRLDGFGLVAAIRGDEDIRGLPVILLSARAGEEARIEGLAAGADDYLIKPFSGREVIARIGSQLELARLRDEAGRALRARGEQFETLLNRAPMGVYLVGPDFHIREVNPVARPAFGDIPGGLIGSDFEAVMRRLWDPAHAAEVVAIFRHTLATGESYIAPERALHRMDRDVTEYYEWRLDRITLPDGHYGLVCYFRDISAQVSARKSVEQSRAALAASDRRKDEFLATLSHELRNPLAPIRNSLRVLREPDLDSAIAHRMHDTLERQVDAMVRLVDDLLETSRITVGKIELRRERVDLAEVVRAAIETSRPLLEAGGHAFTVEWPDDPLAVSADPVRLGQVFANLLNNAAKYTPAPGTIHLAVSRADADALVSVRDNGVGIAADELPRVFDLFTQVGRRSDHRHGGLGVGLMLVRALVELHGGAVEAHSEGEGKGSEFRVRIPLAAAIAPARSATTRGPARALASRRVLVVDDNRDAAETLGMVLAHLGMEVTLAHDGPAALLAIARERPDMVLLDIGLPGMDGNEVARRARTTPEGARATFVALTGWSQEDDRRRSREAGIEHHLVKPADLDALQRLLAGLPTPPERELTVASEPESGS